VTAPLSLFTCPLDSLRIRLKLFSTLLYTFFYVSSPFPSVVDKLSLISAILFPSRWIHTMTSYCRRVFFLSYSFLLMFLWPIQNVASCGSLKEFHGYPFEGYMPPSPSFTYNLPSSNESGSSGGRFLPNVVTNPSPSSQSVSTGLFSVTRLCFRDTCYFLFFEWLIICPLHRREAFFSVSTWFPIFLIDPMVFSAHSILFFEVYFWECRICILSPLSRLFFAGAA